MAKRKEKLSGADRRWGYPIYVDGKANATEAAKILGCTVPHVWRLGDRGLIRRGKRAGARNYFYCVRSIREYQEPVEV